MREKDRYYIFNTPEAFREGVLSGAEWRDGALTLEAGRREGLFITPVMDSGERGNVWRRVLAEAHRPEGTGITYRFYCVNQPYEAQALEEMVSGAGEQANEILSALRHCETFTVENTEDFLPQGVRGRYLMAAVELYGRESLSPSLQGLRIYASQESFLGYLPEIFREEDGFLDRYLRLFSVQYLDLERDVGQLPGLFDPKSAPAESLHWLAEIMGIPHAKLWEENALRGLLSRRVYARKGTLSGLRELIRLYTGQEPYIVESFRMRTGIAENDALYAGNRLIILLPPGTTGGSMDALRVILRDFLPREIDYRLIGLENKARISGYAYLDVNAGLTSQDPAILESDAKIGDAVLRE